MSKKKTHRKTSRSKQNSRQLWLGAALVAAVIAIVVGAILLNDDHKDKTTSTNLPDEISVQEAANRRDQGAFILDVRHKEEWDEYHIPDSTLIPLEELAARSGEIPRDREIIVVCRTGERSAQGRSILLAAGYTQVTSMTGGLIQWRTQGYSVATES